MLPLNTPCECPDIQNEDKRRNSKHLLERRWVYDNDTVWTISLILDETITTDCIRDYWKSRYTR